MSPIWSDVPSDVKDQMDFVLADTVTDVLAASPRAETPETGTRSSRKPVASPAARRRTPRTRG
jgi:hypothetical protein